MRILLTDPHLQSGGQVRYLAGLAGEFTRMQHQVCIGCRTGSVLVDLAKQCHAEVADMFLFMGGLRPAAWYSDFTAACRLIRSCKPDIIHVNGSQDHWTLALANRWLGHPACVIRTRHNTYRVSNSFPNRVLNTYWTDYQIVVCDTVRRVLATQHVFEPSRMCSIHNGVDAVRFQPDQALRTQARQEFGYQDEDIVCGIAARLTPAKGHAFLFEAVAHLRKEIPRLKVLVLGQGSLECHLRTLAQKLDISDHILFAGFREDMAYCIQAFDIGIQPSIDCDTSSFSLKEQMATCIPVIASDYGGLPEVVSDGVEGFVVPTAQVTPLVTALRTLSHEPETRRRMGLAGRERVLKDFTLQTFASKTMDVYTSVFSICQIRKPNTT